MGILIAISKYKKSKIKVREIGTPSLILPLLSSLCRFLAERISAKEKIGIEEAEETAFKLIREEMKKPDEPDTDWR